MKHARIMLSLSILFCYMAIWALHGQCAEKNFREKAELSKEVSRNGYLLSPGDEIDIYVEGEDYLNGTYKIDDEGEITFPILNKISMDGLTVSQAKDKIEKLLEKDYFKTGVNISANITKFHKRKVVISGEVNKPGSYEFEEEKNLTLAELISLAGGPTEKACMNAATIIRMENGKSETLKVKAADIMDAKEKDIALRPGDRVNIPRANVIVMGEVANPGQYSFGDTNKMTLLGAVSMAGGFTRIAAIDNVKVIRVDESGKKRNIKVNVKKIYNGKAKDVPLEPDDIIVVPESWF